MPRAALDMRQLAPMLCSAGEWCVQVEYQGSIRLVVGLQGLCAPILPHSLGLAQRICSVGRAIVRCWGGGMLYSKAMQRLPPRGVP